MTSMISSLVFLIPHWGTFFLKTLNCHIFETIRAFDLIAARPKYQLSSGRLVVEDYSTGSKINGTTHRKTMIGQP